MVEEQVKSFGNVMVVGLGMIGGSFAKALKEKGLATLYGVDRRETELSLGVSTGVIDYPAQLTADFISKMDVIILATPVRAMESVLVELKPHLQSTTLLTDVGSTKGSVIQAAQNVFGCVPENFIPSHPIAGAEKSGVLAANSHLFEKHMAIVTPLAISNPILVDRLHQLWSAVGAQVVSMDVEHHDHVLASSSHLPHLLAYTLVDALANSHRSQDIFKFAAGGFRDFTRIASSDPVMWRDVFLSNKEATLETLDHFTDRLAEMRSAVEQGDGASMFGVFTRAKSARDHFLRLLEHRTSATTKDVKSVSIGVQPASSLKGEVFLIGDKFLSHKAIALACISKGVSQISNIDLSGDVLITLQAFRDMGVVIEQMASHQLRIHGVGLKGLKAPIAPINVHESITSLHLLLPILAAQSFRVKVVGEGALLNRPMTQLFALIRSMGGDLDVSTADCLPVTLGGSGLDGVALSSVDISEELDTSAIFAMLFLSRKAVLTSRFVASVNKELLASFGVDLLCKEGGVSLSDSLPMAAEVSLPGDANQMAWWMLLASLAPGSKLVLKNVFYERALQAYLPALQRANANVSVRTSKVNEFAVAELVVSFSSLSGFDLSMEQVYLLREELPLLCVAAAYATGKTVMRGLTSLPYYYEDRVQSLVDVLMQSGIECDYQGGELSIQGGSPMGGDVDCAGDYPLALAMLAFGVRTKLTTKVDDCQKLLEEFTVLEEVADQVGFHLSVTH